MMSKFPETILESFNLHTGKEEDILKKDEKYQMKPFIIGARLTSGWTPIIRVEDVGDGYIIGRFQSSDGSYGKTTKTIQISTIEYWEVV